MRKAKDEANRTRQLRMKQRGRVGMKTRKQKRLPAR